MKNSIINALRLIIAFLLLLAISFSGCGKSLRIQEAHKILNAAGVKGGLIVHIGCGDGTLTAALRISDSYSVHGLDTGWNTINTARSYIRSKGLYGPVSVDIFDGTKLPYIDNLVNLVIAEDTKDIASDEIMRVLCPGGVAYTKEDGNWKTTVKPLPENIDEWSHYLHDPGNNAVSQDDVIAPPRGLQWVGSPRRARHHDHMASMSALVSSAGRLFYIFDEGSIASIMLKSKWKLIARDAFNGTILWKRSIDHWHPHLWPMKSGPGYLPRRLVALDDVVYVTLGLNEPLTALDAATGETIRTYNDTDGTEEIIAEDNMLFLVVNDTPRDFKDYKPTYEGVGAERHYVGDIWQWVNKTRHIKAIDAKSGEIIWNADYPVVHLTLAVDNDLVFFYDGKEVVCLSRMNGVELWRSDSIDYGDPMTGRRFIAPRYGPTLVVYEDVVLCSAGDKITVGLDTATGKTLWKAVQPLAGHYSAEDVFVIDGLVWYGATSHSYSTGTFTGRDIHTGEIKKKFIPDVDTYWFHHRCYRSKATKNYLLPSRTGIEFIDWRKEHWEPNHWVRGGCVYGIMPCNGLVYAPMNDCACYIEAMLSGFNALTPTSSKRYIPDAFLNEDYYESGPAYGTPLEEMTAQDNDWPTYRHDSARSGFISTAMSTDLKHRWESSIGGALTSPVIANGAVYLASSDEHTVYSLDSKNGKQRWSFTAGGRVDSPPTVYQGRVLFGSADGHVYCLRTSDGQLIWRLRAAPVDMRVGSFEQLESVWPVHGSVLVHDGIVYTVVGRSMFLDGGLRFLRIDAETGKKISESVLNEFDPKTGDNLQSHVKMLNMPVSLPDILSCDGKYIYMRSQCFDLDGNRLEIAPHSGNPVVQGSVQKGESAHLFSPTGFTDDTWFHRSYWVWGRSFAGGHGGYSQAGKFTPGGRILTVDDNYVYGYGRKPTYYRWTSPIEYHLFAAERNPEPDSQQNNKPISAKSGSQMTYGWSHDIPLHVRAIVSTSDLLFLAGPPDVVDEKKAFKTFNDPETKAKLDEQDAALNDQMGGIVWAVSKTDGLKKMEMHIDSMPVFDGMACADECIFMTLENGNIICLGE